MVLTYRNCSIANFPKETSEVNTMKCVLTIMHKAGLTFNKSSHAMAYPKTFSPYCCAIGLAKQTKLKILLN